MESVYLIPLSTLQELPRVIERLVEDFKNTTAAQAVSDARVLPTLYPLQTTT